MRLVKATAMAKVSLKYSQVKDGVGGINELNERT